MTTPQALPYPAHREVDVALRTGASIRLRPLRPDDEPALRAFLDGLSQESRTFRFFSAGTDLGAVARRVCDVDYADRYGVVAIAGDGTTILAHGMYARDEPGRAEVAFAVADALQGEGIATTMLAHLADAARGAGIEQFVADVLPENHRMLDVFRESGFAATVRSEPDALIITMPTELDVGAQRRYDERDAVAAAAAVERVLRPRSVAIVGASARPGSVGGAILRNVLSAGFTGDVHVVNGRGGEVEGRVAHKSVTDVPGELDLAVIAVPAAAVLGVARDCAAKGVRALVVVSAGFGEAGERGRKRQRDLLGICRAAGMRLVGPNCLGVMNTDPAVGLNASFGPAQAPRGRVAFMSQSGALGIAIIDAAAQEGIGLSSFVSVGNKADLSGNDFLAYWDRDEGTDVIVLYLESFGNPRRFSRVARSVASRKPIVAVKGGRSSAGARAAGSHTGALLAASDATVDALFAQSGVIRTDTLGELFDVAGLLSAQPAPAGPRVGIVTNGGGLGILCADACQAAGLDVVATPARTQRALRRGLPDGAAVGNPVDLLASAGPEEFASAIDVLARSGAVDSIVALYVPPLVTDPEAVAAAVREAADAAAVPVVCVFSMPQAPAPVRTLPSFRFPEDAARALGRAARYGAWRAAPAGAVPELDVDDAAAAAIIATALARGPGWLENDEAAALLECYGIAQPRRERVASGSAAAALARRWRVPIALKGVADGLVHRSDVGAVTLGLRGMRTIMHAADAMAERMEAAGHRPAGYVVQEMAAPGVEVLVGAVADPTFGSVVAVAAGGVATELLGDTALRLSPLTDGDAHDMIRELRTFPLLDGSRGAPRADVSALEQALLRISALVEAHHEIVEVECNPLVVSPNGAVAVDVRARVDVPPAHAPEPSLGPAG
ncbi:MAG: bifunctional acetate--CoA ligase family protein/GNAT family N-acetyltransferase [Solirubrobacteraceae bacterium]